MSSSRPSPGAFIASTAQLACLLEAAAAKPGNVSPWRRFHDLAYEDFLASAAAIGPPLASVHAAPVGSIIRSALRATSAWTRSNSNLGIVLLLVPLARAAHDVCTAPAAEGTGLPLRWQLEAPDLRRAVQRVLLQTTVDDSRHVYAAIREANPGGLGRVDAEDVAGDPSLPLLDVMRLAAGRDDIAREYVTGFEVTFTRGVPLLERARADGLGWNDAVVETFLSLLAERPDTHVARRAGPLASEQVSARALAALRAGGVRSADGRHTIEEMDRELGRDGHAANPGTTADLTAAALFVLLLSGGWHRAEAAERP